MDWTLGLRPDPPDTAIAAVTAGIRLDDALRGYLAEQGAKRLSKDDLWQLVMASMRLRLTAHSLAGLRGPAPPDTDRGAHPDRARVRLQQRAAELAAFYDRVAAQVGHPGRAGPVGHIGPTGNGSRPYRPWAAIPGSASPGLEPVHLTDLAPARDGEPSAADAAADEDVAVAEGMVAADTVVVADTVRTRRPQLLWVHEHLRHLRSRVNAISGPATRLADIRQQPWWR